MRDRRDIPERSSPRGRTLGLRKDRFDHAPPVLHHLQAARGQRANRRAGRFNRGLKRRFNGQQRQIQQTPKVRAGRVRVQGVEGSASPAALAPDRDNGKGEAAIPTLAVGRSRRAILNTEGQSKVPCRQKAHPPACFIPNATAMLRPIPKCAFRSPRRMASTVRTLKQ